MYITIKYHPIPPLSSEGKKAKEESLYQYACC